jgi:putative membrane protein insertion efficiency factor
MTRIILAALSAYRTLLRPLLPPLCRFHPSCSDYASEAVEKRGWRGLILAARRLARCHPFHDGGFDPVPHTNG